MPAKKTKACKRITAKTAVPAATHKPYQQARFRYASHTRKIDAAISVPSIARYLILFAVVVGTIRLARFVGGRFAALADGRAPYGHNYRRILIGGASTGPDSMVMR